MARLEIQANQLNLGQGLIIGKRQDGRPIFSISGGESEDEDMYRPNALKRRGFPRSVVERAKIDRATLIGEWRVRDEMNGEKDLSTDAIVLRHDLVDPTNRELAKVKKSRG